MPNTLNFHHKGGPSTAAPLTRIQNLIGGPSRLLAGQLIVNATAYATGGYAADLQQDIPQLTCVIVRASGGYLAEYDATNKKVLLYTAPGTEVANGTSLTLTINFLVLGTI